MPRALVIGSGVAGPATALFLQRAGWDVEVFEAAAEPDAYAGLFLNVATNGLAVLDRLGLRDRLVAAGHRAPEMVMWSSTGKRLGTVPNGPAREPERGSVVVRRGICTRCFARRWCRPASRSRSGPGSSGSSSRMPRYARSSPTDAPSWATCSSGPTAWARRRAATSTRMPRRRRTPDSWGWAGSPVCPASRRPPTRSTWSSGAARSSATSCATTARCTGSRT